MMIDDSISRSRSNDRSKFNKSLLLSENQQSPQNIYKKTYNKKYECKLISLCLSLLTMILLYLVIKPRDSANTIENYEINTERNCNHHHHHNRNCSSISPKRNSKTCYNNNNPSTASNTRGLCEYRYSNNTFNAQQQQQQYSSKNDYIIIFNKHH
jgi:hypothetical protein